MRKLFLIVSAATLSVVMLTACGPPPPHPKSLVNSIVQLPCGLESVANGSFENLNNTYKPKPTDTYMTLFNGDSNISGWRVRTGPRATNGLVWSDNNNQFSVKTPFGDFFVDLTGNIDAADQIPVVVQEGIQLARGK